MPQVRTVNLYGGLAQEHGATHNTLGNNVYMLLSNLYKRNNKLRHDIKSQNWHIYLDEMKPENAISADDLARPLNCKEIHIVPVVEGAGIVAAIVIGVIVGAAIAIFAMPEIPETGNQEDSPSYMFNGSKNVIDQGGPVTILCGICRAGSTVISSGTYAEDFQQPNSSTGSGGGGGGGGTNNRTYLK